MSFTLFIPLINYDFFAEDIVHNGLLKDLSVLQEAPFTDNGSIVEVFTDVSMWQGIRKVIDTINKNAIVA